MTPLRTLLRAATRAEHDRVDAAFGRYDLTVRSDYADFLRRHAAAVLPVEAAVAASGVAADWAERRRGDALLADLAALGVPLPAEPPPFPLADRAEAWGALYVLEGSRLGARVLLRQVAASGDPAVRGAAAYLSHGAGKPLWPHLIAELERSPYALAAPDAVVAGAVRTFHRFEQAARVEA